MKTEGVILLLIAWEWNTRAYWVHMLPLMQTAAEVFPSYCVWDSCASADAQEVVAEHSGWELSHNLPCSPPLNGFPFLVFWVYLNFPIISFSAFPLISVPLVLVLTEFCGLVWPFTTPACRLSSRNPRCVPQGGAFDTSAVEYDICLSCTICMVM